MDLLLNEQPLGEVERNPEHAFCQALIHHLARLTMALPEEMAAKVQAQPDYRYALRQLTLSPGQKAPYPDRVYDCFEDAHRVILEAHDGLL